MTYLIDQTGRRRSSQLMTKSRLGSWKRPVVDPFWIPKDLSVVGFDDTFLAPFCAATHDGRTAVTRDGPCGHPIPGLK